MGVPWLSGVAYRPRLELVWSQALALGGLGLPGRVALGDGVPEGRLRGRVVALGRRLRVERLGGRRGPGEALDPPVGNLEEGRKGPKT